MIGVANGYSIAATIIFVYIVKLLKQWRWPMKRDRSQSMVIRGDRILLVEHELFGRDFYNLPGGGIEEGEDRKSVV